VVGHTTLFVLDDRDEVVRRSLRLVTEGRVTACDGTDIEVHADTICLHGDTTGAVDLASAVRHELESAGVTIRPMGEFIA
jgi:UPF0271 protein